MRRLLPVLGLMALFGAAVPHQAMAATYACSSTSPLGAINDIDAVVITDDGSGCTVASIASGASVTTNTGNLTVNGPISAVGQVQVTSTGAVALQAVTSSGSAVSISNSGGSNTAALAVGATSASTDVTVNSNGAVSVSGVVQATNGNVSLAGNSIASTGNVSAGGSAGLTATTTVNVSGTVNTGTANTSDATITVSAGGDIVTGALTASGLTGNINVSANTNGGGDDLKIGASGVNSTGIITSNVNAGSSIAISNGSSNSGVSNVILNATTAISFNLANTGNSLNLTAFGGTLTLPAGTLSVDGPADKITLLAKEVDTGATTISASQTAAMAGVNHGVTINTDTLKYSGNLTIKANGNGAACDPNTGLCPLASVNISNYTYSTGTQTVQFVGSNGATLDIGADGNYTMTQVMADAISFTGAAVNIHARGTSNNLYVQNAFVIANPTLSVNNTGNFVLDASGTTSDGSSLNVLVGQATLKAPNLTLMANGPTSGNGAGGTIYYSTTSTALDPSSHATLSANAASAGTGNAVYGDPTNFDTLAIDFEPGAVTTNGVNGLNVGTGIGQFSFSANGGGSGGNAGTIEINNSVVTFPPNQAGNAVTASAATATGVNGNGGWVYIPTLSYVDPSAVMLITGHGTGQGGQFLSDTASTFDVYKSIKVDGGTGLAAGSTDGQIKLNTVSCGQIVFQSSWPNTYWDCVTPNSPNTDPVTIANGFSSALKSAYAGHVTELFIFNNAAALNNFYAFQDPHKATSTTAGLTFSFSEPNSAFTLYVNVMENAVRGNNAVALTSPQLKEVTAHEFGHAIDIISGHPATQPTYERYITVDFLNLDYTTIGTDPTTPGTTTVKRDPCVGPNAPFANAIGFDGNPICVNGVVADADYRNHTNSYIAQNEDVNFKESTPLVGNLPTGFYEPFAQTFAFRAYSDTVPLSQVWETVADAVFYASQFACTQGYLNQNVNGSGASGPPAYCATQTIPDWYKIGQ